MTRFSKVLKKHSAAALLSAAAALTYTESAVSAGYELTPLEMYLIESFAQEQIDGFIKTGTSSLFEHPRVFYIQPKAFAKTASNAGPRFRQKYLGQYAIISSHIARMTTDRQNITFELKKPSFTYELTLGSDAKNDLLKDVFPGSRQGFYCKISDVDKKTAKLTECLPLKQFAESKSKQVEEIIHRYLKGEKIEDPNLPTYAMMAYMAVVSAKLLPEDSVCRTTVQEEINYTPADRRLCTQEVSELWQNAGRNPHFDEVMDQVEEQLKRDGVDISPIIQAASALD